MKVSIITVTLNSEKTLKETIMSIYNQNYTNIEHIVIDGKSSDSTLKIIESFKSNFSKKGIGYRWISEYDNGIYDAINKGIKIASGDIIGILNSDDYYKNNDVVSTVVKEFEENNIDCCYGNLEYIDEKTNITTRKWTSKPYKYGDFQKSWTPAHPTFYCKKEIYERYGLYRTDFKIAADVELMYRFLEKHKIIFKFINKNMIVMRKGGISNSGIKSTFIITREMRKVFKNDGSRFSLIKYLVYKAFKMKEFVNI